MSKTVVITQDILINHSMEAIKNLEKIHESSPTLMVFAAIFTAELCETFFKESEKEN